MKILIVDDNPRRYERLMERLSPALLAREDVDIVSNAMDARRYLNSSNYDLLVLDILLPLRAETAPEERHSQELIREIMEGDLKRPHRLVGLSASAEARSAVSTFFTDNLWAVVPYSDANDDWLSQIENCVSYVLGCQTDPTPEHKVDVAIVCALPEIELRATLALPWNWKPARPLDDVLFVHDGTLQNGGDTSSIAVAAAPRMGMVTAALVASKLINALRPRLLLMIGICAGVRGKANIGDVILADPSWDYQSGKRSKEKEESVFATGAHHLPVHPTIRARFDQLKGDRQALRDICDRWPDLPETTPKLLSGPMASGSAVLADVDAINDVRTQHRELLGIEMETYGVYAAATLASLPQPHVLSIKAVCDFGDADKDDRWQRFAAYMAAGVTAEFLRRYLGELKAL